MCSTGLLPNRRQANTSEVGQELTKSPSAIARIYAVLVGAPSTLLFNLKVIAGPSPTLCPLFVLVPLFLTESGLTKLLALVAVESKTASFVTGLLTPIPTLPLALMRSASC